MRALPRSRQGGWLCTRTSRGRRARGEAKGARASFLTDRRGAERHREQGRQTAPGEQGKKLVVAPALPRAEHGRQRAPEHTWDARARRLLEWMEAAA